MVAGLALLLAGGGGAYWQFVLNKPAPEASLPAATTPLVPVPAKQETVLLSTPPIQAPSGSTRPQSSPRPSSNRPSQPVSQPVTPAPQNPAPAPAATGTGTIRVSVPGCGSAEIAIDGRRVGAGRGSFTVSAGSHSVTITGGDAPYSTTVTVSADQATSVVASSVTCTG